MAHDTSTAAVTYEVRNSVAWLTINRPDARNSLNRAVREGLFAGVRRFNDDESAKVLVLTGSGDKAFCAGGDLKEMSQEQLTVPPVDFVPQFGRNIEVDKPTIAAVNGAAFAGGFLLAQTCDLCIASSTATFAISEVKIGRGSPWAAPLPLMVPPRIAMEIVLTGAALTAQRAYEIGFVNQVVEPCEFTDATQQFAELIAANAPLSVSAGKKTAKLTAEHPLSGAFEMAEKIWEPVYLSDDAQEGMLAFNEKRRPHWKGH
ncbi:enoyl-CoA hydratase/isomerase family protein [Rhodococcus sp. JVH1]|uniref:enoyl-CoA hydratase/isomerase family protein n=1 Tax=Rhodococcus sp. JVH1 TaxID=745408 RepID=UPI000271F332|nr:enoyl-CoA hydratase-related protein [Rhodococcus sp. JVH1]EJJ02305.1 enoyl-CoA hydratase/isomerase family protein [Rhodococcus sp. JVH1]